MSCLHSPLGYSTGGGGGGGGISRLCNWLSLRRLVPWINHLPPLCCSAVWKSNWNHLCLSATSHWTYSPNSHRFYFSEGGVTVFTHMPRWDLKMRYSVNKFQAFLLMAQVSHIELHPPRWISLELSGDNYNIGSDNGPVPIGNKPLHWKMLNNSTSPEHNELIALLGKVVLYNPFKQSGELQCNYYWYHDSREGG